MSDRSWSVFRRKKGRRVHWVLKYKDMNAWRQKNLPDEIVTEADAETWAEGWIASRAANGAVPIVRRESGPTPRDIAPRWLKFRREAMEDGKPMFKPATIADNESHLRTEILIALGDTPISRLDVQELRAWIRKLRGAHSSSRVLNVVSTARTFVADAMAEGWVDVPANPFDHPAVKRELPARKAKRGPVPVFVELEHARRLVASEKVPIERRVRWLVLGTTGLDDGELAGRTWADANLGDRPTLRVHTVLATRGEDGWATMGTTKNEYRVRTIPLHRAAAASLRWWYADGWAMYVGRPPRMTDPMFPSSNGKTSRPKSAKQLRVDLFAVGCPVAQHGSAIDAKALRRSFSTWLDAAGVHQEQRGRLMGHRPTTVTAKHYTAAQVETDREAVNTIDIEFVVPSLVPALVPPAPSDSQPQSHLRDLNSRPTVYENVASWCRDRTSSASRSDDRLPESGSAYGQQDTYGSRHHGGLGAGTKAGGGGELLQLRTALGALVAGWDAFDALLAEDGDEGAQDTLTLRALSVAPASPAAAGGSR